MPRVPTMFSLATRPVMEATAACQLPQPRGLKIHASTPPMAARMEQPISSSESIRKLPSTKPKKLVNQTKMVDSRMMVPAFLMKLQPRSHMLRSTFRAVGRW